MSSVPIQGGLPKTWPSSVQYVKKPVFSKYLTADQLGAICRNNVDVLDSVAKATEMQRAIQASPCAVKVCRIDDVNHPAFGQYGLFASRHLEPSTFIIMYLGYVHNEDEADPGSDYDLSLDRDYGVSVDASSMGNEARFINDYRGISSLGPNAEFRDCWFYVQTPLAQPETTLVKCIGVFVLSAGKSGKRKQGIAKDAEILVSYGKGFWQERAGMVEAKSSTADYVKE